MSDVDEDAVMSDLEVEDETLNDQGAEDQKVKDCPLTQEAISQRLSLLCRTGNGLGHAYGKLDLKDRGLTDIGAISTFIHLRFLDLSNNHLTDLSPLASLSHLLWLKVDHNAVESFKGQPFDALTYLQWLSVSGNRLTEVDGLVGPALQTLSLTTNSIKTMRGLQHDRFSNLTTLELRGNDLDTTGGIDLPKLQHLYLAQNLIKRLEGLEKLESLTTLHLRDNQLQTLEGLSPSMKCLQYLNIRGNAILDEKDLKHLGHVSETLRVLVLSDNPVVESTSHRLSALTVAPKLERVDKDLVSSEERTQAKKMIRDLKEEEIPEPQHLY